ncbi:MAG: hypothetical protein ABL970_02240 [Nitrospira sp.]
MADSRHTNITQRHALENERTQTIASVTMEDRTILKNETDGRKRSQRNVTAITLLRDRCHAVK